MRRYSTAFILSCSVYVLIGCAFFYQHMHCFVPQKSTAPSFMAMTLYAPPKKEVPQTVNSVKELEKKVEPLKPQPDVHPKKPRIKESSTLKRVTQKEPLNQSFDEASKTESIVASEEVSHEEENAAASVSEEPLHVKQKAYLEALIKRINAHKIYPKAAQKGQIEGDVLVEFTISPKGELISCVILEGKNIFTKATEKAIYQSFPYTSDETLFTSNMTFQITLKYSLL